MVKIKFEMAIVYPAKAPLIPNSAFIPIKAIQANRIDQKLPIPPMEILMIFLMIFPADFNYSLRILKVVLCIKIKWYNW